MILDTNAVSAWAEGLATVEASLRSADRLGRSEYRPLSNDAHFDVVGGIRRIAF